MLVHGERGIKGIEYDSDTDEYYHEEAAADYLCQPRYHKVEIKDINGLVYRYDREALVVARYTTKGHHIMGWLSRAKGTAEEMVDAVVDYKRSSDLGTAIGQEAYRQGVDPGSLDQATIERIAQANGLNPHKYLNSDIVDDHITESYEQAAYEHERKSRGWHLW